MRRSELATLLIAPNVTAAIIVTAVWAQFPSQGLLIGTFLGIYFVAYAALSAPWISGYLRDKWEHTKVLNRLVFAKYDWLNMGGPGISRQQSRRQFADRWELHFPMAITGSYLGKVHGGVGEPMEVRYWVELTAKPEFSSASNHIRAYPKFARHWEETKTIQETYNSTRTRVLSDFSAECATELAAAFPKLEARRTTMGGPVSGPFYDPESLAAVVYLRIEDGLVTFPLISMPIVGTKHHSSQLGVGLDLNSLIVVSDDPADRDIPKIEAMVARLSQRQRLREGVSELMRIEDGGSASVNQLQQDFGELSLRIELGHRIQGTCREVGY